MEAKDALVAILGCGYEDIDMLLASKIDLSRTVDLINESGERISFNEIYYEAFWDKVCEYFTSDNDSDDSKVSTDDFDIFTNFEDTSIYIKHGKYHFYHENYPDEINSIENYLGLEFEDVD